MNVFELYTAAFTTPKHDSNGIACIFLTPDGEAEWYTTIGDMTQNQADIEAVIRAVEQVQQPSHIKVLSNSQLVVKCGNREWGRNSNVELWERLDATASQHDLEFTWIRKNSHRLNRRAHKLASSAARKQVA